MKSPRALLGEHGLSPKPSFGQNFLVNDALLERLAALTGSSALVIEIGAGLGQLTRALLLHGHRVAAIERDRDLLPILRGELAPWLESSQLTLLEADAKQVDYSAQFQALAHGAPEGIEPNERPKRVLTGNLPYHLSGPLLRRAVELAPELDSVVFLLQLEVANRLASPPGDKIYGALSVFTQAAFEVRREFLVPSGSFYPRPRVDSAAVKLTPRTSPPGVATPWFTELVRAAFQMRRKRLRNAWAALRPDPSWRQTLDQAALAASVDLEARGETLAPSDFARLAQELQIAFATRHES